MPLSDFDFLLGRWTIRNRALCNPLSSSHDWCEFAATYECRSLGELGNIGYFRACRDGLLLEGAGLRLYNPETAEWTIRWADTLRAGAIQPPVVGQFDGPCGVFYGNAFYNARPIRTRVIWTRGRQPRFEQAFSTDRGETWAINWHMVFTAVVEKHLPEPALQVSATSIGPPLLRRAAPSQQ